MQCNSKKFNAHEESRLLNDIRLHRQGIQQLEMYEEKKNAYENLKMCFNEKKNEQDVIIYIVGPF